MYVNKNILIFIMKKRRWKASGARVKKCTRYRNTDCAERIESSSAALNRDPAARSSNASGVLIKTHVYYPSYKNSRRKSPTWVYPIFTSTDFDRHRFTLPSSWPDGDQYGHRMPHSSINNKIILMISFV